MSRSLTALLSEMKKIHTSDWWETPPQKHRCKPLSESAPLTQMKPCATTHFYMQSMLMPIFNLKRIPVVKLQPIPAVNSYNVHTYPMTETFTVLSHFSPFVCVINWFFYMCMHIYASGLKSRHAVGLQHVRIRQRSHAVLSCPSCVFCVCSPCRLVWAPCPLRRTAASWRPPGSDQSRTARACGRYQPVVDTNVHTHTKVTHAHMNIKRVFCLHQRIQHISKCNQSFILPLGHGGSQTGRSWFSMRTQHTDRQWWGRVNTAVSAASRLVEIVNSWPEH